LGKAIGSKREALGPSRQLHTVTEQGTGIALHHHCPSLPTTTSLESIPTTFAMVDRFAERTCSDFAISPRLKKAENFSWVCLCEKERAFEDKVAQKRASAFLGAAMLGATTLMEANRVDILQLGELLGMEVPSSEKL